MSEATNFRLPSASAAVCNNYGVGIAIIPQFVGTNDIAVIAYPGEIIERMSADFARRNLLKVTAAV